MAFVLDEILYVRNQSFHQGIHTEIRKLSNRSFASLLNLEILRA